MKKITSLMMSLLLILSTMSIIAFSATAASTPKLSKTAVTIYYKASTTLKVTGYSKTVKWSSSNTKVAKVTSKGVVTGAGLGTATVTAKAGNKTLKCKVTVKDRNVTASTSFKVAGGGYFINKESKATVAFKPKSYNAAKVTVYIVNSAGDSVYKKTFTNCTKNKKYSFSWNGKNSKGKYVPTDSYRVKVVIGKKASYSSYLSVYSKNYFADGNGSKSNPFLIETENQLKSIVRFPNAYYKQMNDLDFEYESVGGFFSADQPFSGVYDGNGKTISNISANVPLFNVIGEKATVKNLKMKDCNVVGNKVAILASTNYGKISGCSINGNVTATGGITTVGALAVVSNNGTITNSEFSGTVNTNSTEYDAHAGGIVGYNGQTAKIISCISNTKSHSKTDHWDAYAGGIASVNWGLINNCEATGEVSVELDKDGYYLKPHLGGIAGRNDGQIIGSYYMGSSSVNLAGDNNGTIGRLYFYSSVELPSSATLFLLYFIVTRRGIIVSAIIIEPIRKMFPLGIYSICPLVAFWKTSPLVLTTASPINEPPIIGISTKKRIHIPSN